MLQKCLLFAGCLILAGCASAAPSRIADVAPKKERNEARALAVNPDVIADLPQGAKVELISGPTESIVGTVLHASADGVALLNCEQTHGSESDPAVFHRHIPVHWTSIRLIVAVRVLSDPPEDYVAPRLDIDTNDAIVEIDGKRKGITVDYPVY